MSISNESKDLIRGKIVDLQTLKQRLQAQIDSLKTQRDLLVAELQAVNLKIDNFQNDIK